MSPIAVGLDLLLVALLVTALTVGWRLNARLKALRDGQAGFVKAVAELDAAATRAESGLKALRAASEDTHDELLTRIETARALITRLEDLSTKATRLAEPVQPAAPARPAALSALSSRLEARLETFRREPGRTETPRPEPRAESSPASRFTAPAQRPLTGPGGARHAGARGLDDDLFEAGAPVLPHRGLGGRRP